MSPAGRAVDGRGTAVVIGGGLAGCLAAWALRGVAERVVVIERDRYPERADFRPGVPQARHGHLLLEAGHRTIEELMPGAVAELLAAGATRVPVSAGLRWLTAAGWLAPYESELAVLTCSRPVIDHVVLDRVRTEPTIEILTGTEVVGLLGGRHAVTGVQVRDRGSESSHQVREIAAELVIDAAGRGTRAAKWLSVLGAPAVPRERVDAGVAYATRFYHRPPGADSTALYVQSRAPQQGRFGVLLPVEGDRWIVGTGGMRGFEPSLQPEEFEKQLGQLRDPAIAEAIVDAEPAGPARGFVPGPSVWRHYERTAPHGFLALGDASCTFNPVYGQGMTVTALAARALREAVRQHGDLGHAAVRETRQAIAGLTKNPWMMSSSEDVRFAGTTGGPSGALVRVQHRFLDRILARATTDGQVAAAFQRVAAMVEPPSTLFRPAVLRPVLFGG
ncbi:NAD(P)/FAD-dependent oxidoreductase [Streptomyces sp. TLI_171]|uniref:NAD(P)/FAD-dependent oxidoreductase n=1 Tax=Streptomyces sp. TLI_171 TaxID=1938859 RepID=UPI000C191840|nr:FAD-dependent monooxygenase [Streptomyces sp. TLI_171]RKE17693.1 flavin-dependent dehydrogenase [Streptomyces sp. TLI_171]